jgi:hypothetical protein
MPRKLRIAAVGALVLTALLAAILGGAFYATRQVRPFYEQALRIEPEVMERSSRELESRATALYSDVKQIGHWQALFTAQQINSWLAKQQAADKNGELLGKLRDPRIALTRDCLTLGFRYNSGGVDTVFSVEAAVFLMNDGAVGIRFMSARAGALPLPVIQAAEVLATASHKRNLPVRWTQEKGRPVAIVNIASSASTQNREFFIDKIDLRNGEMYVGGHTEVSHGSRNIAAANANIETSNAHNFELNEFELRLTPSDEHSALEIARREPDAASESENAAKR